MGGFDDEAIDALEAHAEVERMSYHATEVSHLREVIDSQGRQISALQTEVKGLNAVVLSYIDRVKYYGEAPTREMLEEIQLHLNYMEKLLK